MIIDLDRLQAAMGDYDDTHWSGGSDTKYGCAIAEEGGEVCRCLLKREQGIRGRAEDWTVLLRTELADLMITALTLAQREGFSLADALIERWMIVENRGIHHDPVTLE